jgi:uncharacterized protein (TIGR03067 family)
MKRLDDRRSPSGRPCVPGLRKEIGVQSLIGMALLASVLTAVGFPPLPWSDRGRLQGQWVVVACENQGRPTDQLNGAIYIFDADKLAIRSPYFDLDGKPFQLTTGREPPHIDIVVGPSRVIRGIYKLHGDELTLCTGDYYGGTDDRGHLVAQIGQRPTAFDSRQGSLVVLRRKPGGAAAAAPPNGR